MVWEIIGDVLRLTVLAGLGIAGIVAILLWKKNLATRVTYLRLIIQMVAFATIFYIFSYTIPLLYVLIIILTMTIVLGRFYCGWLCPFGFFMDLLTLLRRATKIRYRVIPDKLNKSLHKFRYVLLLFLLLIPVILWLLDPREVMVSPMMARILAGHYRPYSILLGPMITMVVSWAGQLVIGPVNFSFPYLQEAILYLGQDIGQIFSLIFVGLVVAGSLAIKRVWCRFCPTGISLAIRGSKWSPSLYLDKDETKCTKCGICKRVCPAQVTEVYDQKGGKINTSMCMLCVRCVEMCPYKDALKVKLGNKTVFKSRNWLEPSTAE